MVGISGHVGVHAHHTLTEALEANDPRVHTTSEQCPLGHCWVTAVLAYGGGKAFPILSWTEATRLARIHPDVVVRLFDRKVEMDSFWSDRCFHHSGLAVKLERNHPERRREMLELGAWGDAARWEEYDSREQELANDDSPKELERALSEEEDESGDGSVTNVEELTPTVRTTAPAEAPLAGDDPQKERWKAG